MDMEVEVKVTNPALYKEMVSEVNLDLQILDSETFNGGICIMRKDNLTVPFYGLIEAKDYESKYGFVLALCEPTTKAKILLE